jgi:hypothetical protein
MRGRQFDSINVARSAPLAEARGSETIRSTADIENAYGLCETVVPTALPELRRAFETALRQFDDDPVRLDSRIPEGAKMAKIHWNPKKMETFPAATVPSTQHDIDFMVKTARGSRIAAGGDMPHSTMTLHPIRSVPAPRLTSRRRGTAPNVGSRVTRW